MDYFLRVKALAREKGTTIEAAALAAGLTRDAYNSYRKKGNLPRADEAVAMALFLGTSVEYLTTGKETAGWQPVPRIRQIVEDLIVLTDTELDAVGVMVHPLAERRRATLAAAGGG